MGNDTFYKASTRESAHSGNEAGIAESADHGRGDLEQALRRAEERYALLAGNTPDFVYSLDSGGGILEVNAAVAAFGYSPEALVGQSFGDLIQPDDRSRGLAAIDQMIANRENCSLSQQFRIITRSRDVRWLEDNRTVRFDAQGRFVLMEGICKDITAIIADRKGRTDAEEDSDEQARLRAAELLFANEALQKELRERKAAERGLREREADMEREMSTLQEANTALKVLIKRREADRNDFEDQVMYNVKELLLPYMDKLKAVSVDERQKAYLSILESNLNEITAPFSRRLSIEYFDLTPAEMKVANFIRQGKRSRDMASLLGLSVRTIESYRLSIRRKMRLQNKKINLRTFLLTIR